MHSLETNSKWNFFSGNLEVTISYCHLKICREKDILSEFIALWNKNDHLKERSFDWQLHQGAKRNLRGRSLARRAAIQASPHVNSKQKSARRKKSTHKSWNDLNGRCPANLRRSTKANFRRARSASRMRNPRTIKEPPRDSPSRVEWATFHANSAKNLKPSIHIELRCVQMKERCRILLDIK